MRSLRKSWIGFILIFFFAISLFFWRQSSYVSNIFNSDNIIAKVGNTTISTTRFNRTMQMNIQRFNDILGKQLTGKEIKELQIQQLALGAIINESVFENEFNDLNFKLDETIIAKKTKEAVPELYDNNNQLNENYLKQFLSNQGLKIEDIVQLFHYDARNNIFNSALLDLYFPKSFSKKIENYDIHSRDIEYLNIPIESININNILENSSINLDTILSEFYKNNISQYQSKETRNVEYILINKENFIKDFIPTDNEVLLYYDNNKELFIKKEKRSFIQFNFKTLNEANEFKKIIFNKNSLKEVENYANNEKIKYNLFNDLAKDEVLKEISEILFTLNINEQSKVIKTPVAYHVIILKEIKPEKQLSFQKVKNDIQETISNNDVKNYLIDLENQISQNILDNFNLKEISKKYDLKLKMLKSITKDYDQFDKKQEIFFNDIIQNAFLSNLNFINDIVKLNQDNYYIYEVTDITESQPLDFNNVKNQVFNNWKIYKKIEKIELEIKNKNKELSLLNNLEKRFNLKINNFSIKKSNKKIPNNLTSIIFNSNINDISYIIDKDRIHIAKLLKINIKDKLNEINNKIALNDEIRKAVYFELLKNVNISTNDQLIEAILNNY